MSTRDIPYPTDFDIDQAAAHHEAPPWPSLPRRGRRAGLTAGGQPDPAKHPLYPVVTCCSTASGPSMAVSSGSAGVPSASRPLTGLVNARLQGED